MLFNVGLVAEAGHPAPVKLAAVDLARNSHWFQVGPGHAVAGRRAVAIAQSGLALTRRAVPRGSLARAVLT